MTAAELELALNAYMAVRQAMGYTMRAERTLLPDFVRFLIQRGELNPIRAQAALDWATQLSLRRGASGTSARLGMARRFLAHLRACYPDTELPGTNMVAAGKRPKPYLFSEGEIAMISEAALQTGPRGSLRPHTLFTLVGLLASTGLRVGEALHLDVNDVQLQTELPRLHVRDTKFGKSRLVPVHATTASMLRLYIRKRTELGYDGLSNSFLVSEQGTGLRISNVDRWFSQLVLWLGLWPDKGKSWPCLRCFRHTFAVRRLRAWYEEGADVAMLLPHLSVYLGHVDLEESYWYLTATPELLDHASVCFERYAHVGGQQ